MTDTARAQVEQLVTIGEDCGYHCLFIGGIALWHYGGLVTVAEAKREEVIAILAAALREARREDEGKLWSFFRRVLAQGGAIEADYRTRDKSYEEYSARLDAAAHERAEEWLRQRAK